MQHLFEHREREILLTGFLSWLRTNFHFFDQPQEDDLLDIAPEEIHPDKRRKAYCELGLALRLTARVAELAENSEVRWLINEWVELANRRQIFFDVKRRVQLFPRCIVAYAVLKSLGYSEKSVYDSLQTVLDRGFIGRAEISAWHKLDLKYYLNLIGLRHEFASDETLLGESTLTRLPALTHATTNDLYALTHIIFYFSDFGAKDIRSFLGQHFGSVREYSGLALSMCVAMQDWDLTAELLLSRICLGVQDDPLDREAARALCQYRQPAGFIPGRAWMHATLVSEELPEHAEQKFFDVYHPTLLTLCLICCDAQMR